MRYRSSLYCMSPYLHSRYTKYCLRPAFAVQQHADLVVSVAHSCLSDFADTHPQLNPWIAAVAIVIRPARHAQNPARMPFTRPQQLIRRSTIGPRRRFAIFLESTPCSIEISSTNSATSFFLEVHHPPNRINLQVRILRLLTIECLFADLALRINSATGNTDLSLLQHADDLFHTQSLLLI
jgi:hypothetical protein